MDLSGRPGLNSLLFFLTVFVRFAGRLGGLFVFARFVRFAGAFCRFVRSPRLSVSPAVCAVCPRVCVCVRFAGRLWGVVSVRFVRFAGRFNGLSVSLRFVRFAGRLRGLSVCVRLCALCEVVGVHRSVEFRCAMRKLSN